jgi:hypothetical protein
VCPLGIGVGGVTSGDLLRQVLGEVANAPRGVLASGEEALGVEPGPEPDDVQRLIVRADRVEGLVEGRQQLPGRRVDVAAAGLMPEPVKSCV